MVSANRTIVMPVDPSLPICEDPLLPGQGDDEDVIILEIEHYRLPITVPKGQQVVLGRHHLTNTVQPQIDLTPYGALAAGCSRQHAAIGHDEAGWWIKDLNSSNGTWLEGERVAPMVEHRLTPINMIWLTKLDMRIYLPK